MKRARRLIVVLLAAASAGAAAQHSSAARQGAAAQPSPSGRQGAAAQQSMAAEHSAAAQPGRIHFAFGGLQHRAAETSEVALDGPTLQLGIRMLSESESDAEARAVLARLKGVYVESFRFDREGEYSARDLEDIRRQLQAPGWTRILSVQSRREREAVDVYVMSTAKGVAGMAIIAAYPKELRVVNLVGPIDPAALSRLGGHFGIPRVETGEKNETAGGDGTKPGSQR